MPKTHLRQGESSRGGHTLLHSTPVFRVPMRLLVEGGRVLPKEAETKQTISGQEIETKRGGGRGVITKGARESGAAPALAAITGRSRERRE